MQTGRHDGTKGVRGCAQLALSTELIQARLSFAAEWMSCAQPGTPFVLSRLPLCMDSLPTRVEPCRHSMGEHYVNVSC